MNSINKNIRQAAVIGAMAGSRTSAAPFVVNYLLRRRNRSVEGFNWLSSKKATLITSLMAAGELLADKLPQTPARIAAGGIAGRCLSGALAGAAVFRSAGNKWYIGALTGAAAAAAFTFACYFIRKEIVKRTDIPDPIVGGAEDLLVLLGGAYIIVTD